MEDFFAIVLLLLFFVFFVGGIYWLMGKFFGVRVVGRFGVADGIRANQADEIALSTYDKADIEEGIKRCERKMYSKTHTNVLAEVIQLIKEREGRTTSDLIKKGIQDAKENASSIISQFGKDKYDQLEKIGRLRDAGILTSEEFEKEKNRILKKN